MSTNTDKALTLLGAAFIGCSAMLLALIFIILLMLIDGYVVYCYWYWFLKPAFLLGDISLAQAIGLSLVASYPLNKQLLVTKGKDLNSLDQKDKRNAAISIFTLPFFALAIGYLVYLFT